MIAAYLLFFFAGIGAFNALALAIGLLLRRSNAPAPRWLALLILALSVRTGKSVLFYFYPELSKLVLQVGLTACLMIGPCLIALVRAWSDPAGQRTRHDARFVAALLAAAIVLGAAFPYSEYPQWWSGAPAWRVVMYGWLACVAAAAVLCRRAFRRAGDAADGIGRGQLAAIVAAVAGVWLAYFTAGYTSYIVGPLSFSLALYAGVAVWFAGRRPRAAAVAEPYRDRKIVDDEAQAELQALHRLMDSEALYTDAQLSLAKLARRLNMPPARLSQLLNDNHKTAFKPYLMQLRVDAAKRLLQAPGQVMMEQVAEASGFLSMSTFYSSFKKLEGTTPAAWRQARSAAAADS